MKTQEIQLGRDVMTRVRTVYLMRLVWNVETAKGAVLLGCCLIAVYIVSIPNIVMNMSHTPGIAEGAAYLFAAFLHTEVLVQGLVVLGLATSTWLAIDAARNMKVKSVYLYPFRLTTGLIHRMRSA